jgi:hypothetical protein
MHQPGRGARRAGRFGGSAISGTVVGVSRLHAADRPGWLCKACGEPWPCPARRDQLSDHYALDPLGLTALMSGYLAEASAEIGDITGIDLYQRFLAWTRRHDDCG